MKYWQVEETGQAPVLRQAPPPPLAPGKVRLRVHACGLNFADLLMLQGQYQERPPFPYVPGLEFAGEVLEGGTADLPAGSRVAAFAGSGGLAGLADVAPDRLLRLPDRMSFDQAAAFQVAYGTSHLALDHKARLQPGETLLVLGAAGGVGLTAVEIGKRMGARVIACARGPAKLQIARQAGADILIDSDEPDLRQRLKDLGGVDVTYDTVGGAGFDAALSASRPEGRLLAIGFAGGQVPQIPANRLLVKNLSVMGLYWGGYLAFAPRVLTDSLRRLLAWFEAGELHPHVSHSLPFEELPQGLSLLRERRSTGKVVIRGPED